MPPHMLEFLCAGTDAYNRFALAAGDWRTGQVRPTTAQCRVLTASQSTRAVALYANNKRTRVTSKLALWFFYHSRTALVVRGVYTTWFLTKLYAHSMRYR